MLSCEEFDGYLKDNIIETITLSNCVFTFILSDKNELLKYLSEQYRTVIMQVSIV